MKQIKNIAEYLVTASLIILLITAFYLAIKSNF